MQELDKKISKILKQLKNYESKKFIENIKNLKQLLYTYKNNDIYIENTEKNIWWLFDKNSLHDGFIIEVKNDIIQKIYEVY